MRKVLILSAALSLSGMVLCSGVGLAQRGLIGNWTAAGNDPGHSGWQKAETKISKETAGTKFKYLWKIKLGTSTKDARNFTEPLLAPRLINAHGFKDLVLWASTDTVYAVDSELGAIVWKKKFETSAGACGPRNMSIVLEPPVVINFGARRAPGAPRPAAPPPPPIASQRRLGVSVTGGFALKGLYVLAGDGRIHEQVLTTGVDYAPSAPSVKFLPGTMAADGLNMIGKTILTSTSSNCPGSPNGVWGIDVANPDYTVSSYATQKISPLGLAAPIAEGGAVYTITGSGTSDPSKGVYANSVVALSEKDLKVTDWYTPAGGGRLESVTPTAFAYKGKRLVVAPGKDGSYVLLDAASLGGADHQTPLAETARISKAPRGAYNGLASWQDESGTAWVLASISGPVEGSAKFATTNGAATHGSIVAFKVEDEGGKMTLTPAWVSRDMINPASPVAANGTVVALSQGNATTHARLYVLDATTGKELYSSGDSIPTYAHLTGVSVGDGHAFFTTHDNMLYSFGIALEH
jgi:outer membrane protein assembly factor BamB